jgi:hypothetical protein
MQNKGVAVRSRIRRQRTRRRSACRPKGGGPCHFERSCGFERPCGFERLRASLRLRAVSSASAASSVLAFPCGFEQSLRSALTCSCSCSSGSPMVCVPRHSRAIVCPPPQSQLDQKWIRTIIIIILTRTSLKEASREPFNSPPAVAVAVVVCVAGGSHM